MTVIPISSEYKALVYPNEKSQFEFCGLLAEDHMVIKDWIRAVDFIECLQAYIKNHLVTEKYYDEGAFCFEVIKKDHAVLLEVSFEVDYSYQYTKLEAARIAHKLNRVLSRCDLFLKTNTGF